MRLRCTRGPTHEIYEVIEYGPIVHADEESGSLITVNGAYLNWWSPERDGEWVNTECRYWDRDLSKTTVVEAKDQAKAWFNEVVEDAESLGHVEGQGK